MKEERILSIDQFIAMTIGDNFKIEDLKESNNKDVLVEIEIGENGKVKLLRYQLLNCPGEKKWIDGTDIKIKSTRDFFDTLLLQKGSYKLNEQGNFSGLRLLPLLPLASINDHWEFVNGENNSQLIYADITKGKITYCMGFRKKGEDQHYIEPSENIPVFWQEIYKQFLEKELSTKQRNQIVVLAALVAQMPDICTKYGWNVENEDGAIRLKSPSAIEIDLDNLKVRFNDKQAVDVYSPTEEGKEYNLSEEVESEMQNRMSDNLEL